jgi:hypothetical protein
MKIPERAKRCASCNGDSIGIGVTQNRGGATVHPFYCLHCGEVSQQYASQKVAAEYAAQHGPLTKVMTKTERKIAEGKISPYREEDYRSCEVCGSTEKIEKHHWAPWHLFGPESEEWPTSYLCQSCHVRWHQTVTPDMSKRKGPFS